MIAGFKRGGKYGEVTSGIRVRFTQHAAIAEERGHLEPGARVGWLGIGSGLNCMMLGVEW